MENIGTTSKTLPDFPQMWTTCSAMAHQFLPTSRGTSPTSGCEPIREPAPAPSNGPLSRDAVIARVIAVDRGRYTCVVNEQSEDQRTVVCIRAKELRRRPIVPGDQVGVVGDVSGDPDTLARIVRIEPRAPASCAVARTTPIRWSA